MRRAKRRASPSANAGKPSDPGGVGLTVDWSNYDEIFTDTVRIPRAHRIDYDNTVIPNGTIIRIDHNGKKAFAIVRGIEERAEPVIQMDEFIRDRLSIERGAVIPPCCIRSATAWEKIVWYLQATNPAVHVPAWLAVISIGLGIALMLLSLALA